MNFGEIINGGVPALADKLTRKIIEGEYTKEITEKQWEVIKKTDIYKELFDAFTSQINKGKI